MSIWKMTGESCEKADRVFENGSKDLTFAERFIKIIKKSLRFCRAHFPTVAMPGGVSPYLHSQTRYFTRKGLIRAGLGPPHKVTQ